MAKRAKCPICKGKGMVVPKLKYACSPSSGIACGMCDRKGEIILEDGSEVCKRCKGIGGKSCGMCHGRGIMFCDMCYGLGKIKTKSTNSWTDNSAYYKCNNCDGSGIVKCDKCNGSGKIDKCDKCGGSGIFKINNIKRY